MINLNYKDKLTTYNVGVNNHGRFYVVIFHFFIYGTNFYFD